nr:hypothetical protein Iba_chr13bCG4630 [Ipomoea batatas]
MMVRTIVKTLKAWIQSRSHPNSKIIIQQLGLIELGSVLFGPCGRNTGLEIIAGGSEIEEDNCVLLVKVQDPSGQLHSLNASGAVGLGPVTIGALKDLVVAGICEEDSLGISGDGFLAVTETVEGGIFDFD